MPKSHARYAPEYRRRMVELGRTGRSPDDLAKEFEPTAQSIRNWVAQAERFAKVLRSRTLSRELSAREKKVMWALCTDWPWLEVGRYDALVRT
jgi:transposase